MEIGGTAHSADKRQQKADEYSGQKKGNGPVLLFQRKHQCGDHNSDHTKGNKEEKKDRDMRHPPLKRCCRKADAKRNADSLPLADKHLAWGHYNRHLLPGQGGQGILYPAKETKIQKKQAGRIICPSRMKKVKKMEGKPNF